MKKWFLTLLSALMLTLAFTAGASAETDSTGLWEYSNWGTESNPALYIAAYLGAESEVTIPTELDGKRVMGVMGLLDYGKTNNTLVSLTIPGSLDLADSAGNMLGGFQALQNIYIEGEPTFYTSVDGVLFTLQRGEPGGLEYYPAGRPATSYTVPDGTSDLNYQAFCGSVHLEEVILPDSISYCSSSVFASCPKLKTVRNLPRGLNHSYGPFFNNCPALESLYYAGTRSEFLSEPYGRSSFYNGSSYVFLHEFAVCAGSSFADGWEYEYSSELGGAVITDYTGSAASVTVPSTIGGYTVKQLMNTFYNNDTVTSVTVPASVKEIGRDTFYDCDSLTTLSFASGSALATIGDSAFSNCDALTSVTLPFSVTSIGNYAFAYCSALRSAALSSSLQTIGNSAFSQTALSSVSIPAAVTSIGTEVFPDTLSSITVDSSNTSYCAENNALYTKDKSVLLRYASASTATSFTVPSSVVRIERYAFSGAASLQELYLKEASIDSKLTTISYGALQNCTKLRYVYRIPQSLRSIEYGAFGGCTAITHASYLGSKQQWNANVSASGNSYLTNKLSYVTESSSGHVAHPVCGVSCDCEDTTHGTYSTWYAWNGSGSISSGYYYYLTQDATLPVNYQFTGSGAIRICLNGHTLTIANSDGDGLYIGPGFTLILCDCTNSGGIKTAASTDDTERVLIYNDGKLTIYGGTYDSSASKYSTAIDCQPGSTFTMRGGTVKGTDTALQLYSDTTATVYDGTLSSTSSNTWSNTVVNAHGTFTMYDGEISCNTGNARAISLDNWGTASIHGGLISRGGSSADTVDNSGTLTVTGGTIDCSIGNSAILNSGTVHLSGGNVLSATSYSGGKTIYTPAVHNYHSNSRCYLSGSAAARIIRADYPDSIIAASPDGSSPYGNSLSVRLLVGSPDSFGADDAVVTSVNTDALAELFYLTQLSGQTGLSLRHVGTELQLVRPVASGECGAEGDNLLWTLDNGGTLTITGKGEMADYNTSNSGHTNAPWISYADRIKKVVTASGVTSIGDCAFYYDFDSLTDVELSDTVERLGKSAFGSAKYLASINFPDSLTDVGEYCFDFCLRLRITSLPKNVTVYQPYSFRHVGEFLDVPITSLVIPDGVTEIGSGAFAEWYDLTALTLPNSLVTVAEQAFYKNRVVAVTIPASVESIGHDAFGWDNYDNKHLKSVYFCGDAPDTSSSYGRPFSSNTSVKLYVREGATGFLADGYSAYARDVWAEEDHCTVAGSYVPATSCKESGYTEYFCPVSGCLYKKYDDSALPHTPENFAGKDATCTEDGHEAGTRCSVCDELLSGGEVIKASHKEVPFDKLDATCTEDGHEAGTRCSICDELLSGGEVIKASHKEVPFDKLDATCTEDGHEAGTRCSVCDELLSGGEVIKASHKEVSFDKLDATCTEDGHEAGTRCSVCDELLSGGEVIKASHKEVSFDKLDATCTEDGHEAGTRCSVCDELLSGGEVIKASHKEVSFDKLDATCTEDGHEAGTRCSVCDELLSGGEVIEATGHRNFGSWSESLAPTPLFDGEEERFCSCGHRESRAIPATGPALADSIGVRYDPASRTVLVSGVPEDLMIVLAAYDGTRLSRVYAAQGGLTLQFTLPEELSFTELKLFFLTADYRPIALPRRIA